MSRRDTPSGISARQRQLIQTHAADIADLPRGEFVTCEEYRDEHEYADIERSIQSRLSRGGIITAVGRKHGGARVYRVPEQYHAEATALAADQHSPCGCGHTGVQNLGGGQYTCSEDCGVRVTRAEVEF